MKVEQRVFVQGTSFLDSEGRTLLFRGCSVGGDSKIPLDPEAPPESVSFVGRPFPEQDADTHFARLAGWGFNLVRLVITWEAVEHAGPGIYDEEYLSYLRNIVKAAEPHGIFVYLDPHQDAWSRFTGGSGAPAWTLEAAGFDLSRLESSGAATGIAGSGPVEMPNRTGSSPTWPLNYQRYACATMFTLFFGGNTFAPGRLVEGVPVQDWLQDHFIDAMRHTARRLKDCPNLIGFGTLNEPHSGFIGLASLNSHTRMMAPRGAVPSAFEAMAAGSGLTVDCERYSLFGARKLRGAEKLNEKGISLFRDGFQCPWFESGAWAVRDGKPFVLKDGFFDRGDFAQEYLKPFQKRFIEAVSKKREHFIFFAEGVPMGARSSWTAEDFIRSDGKALQIAESFHWYEGFLLAYKQWRPYLASDSLESRAVLGSLAVKKSVTGQFAHLAAAPRSEGIPAIVGEFGVPFDLKGGKGFKTGDWSANEEAFSLYYEAIDASGLHSLIWNYSASNRLEIGDGWNGEDFSIWSEAAGEGRALRGFSRPWPVAVSGTGIVFAFDVKTRVFTLTYEGKPGKSSVFVPSHWFPSLWEAEAVPGESGTIVLEADPENQCLHITAESACFVKVRIRPL